MNIKERIIALSKAHSCGNVDKARDLAFSMLSKHCECEKSDNLTVFGYLKGESDYTIMLDAHIDQIAMVVTDIDDKGFLTVDCAGGIDVRTLPSRRVTIHAKKEITGVFCATPPHLADDKTQNFDISKLKIDTALSSKAKEIISLGDIVTFKSDVYELLNDKIAGPSFDDRAGVACLIEVAKRLKDEKLPVNVAFVLSDAEELGLRGTRTVTYKVNPNEAIAVDVSFGFAPDIEKDESGELSGGAMVGFSPCLCKEMSQKLVSIASEKNIPYQTEIMSSKSGTNADMIAITRQGVKTVTLSIPIRNMHTDCEILSISDLESTTQLLCEYVRNGGVFNDR